MAAENKKGAVGALVLLTCFAVLRSNTGLSDSLYGKATDAQNPDAILLAMMMR
ncbi:hypothetical protein [Parachitinimonas caeni]|uniref:Uncharacterized protein n=1 Tax=Parachitinimonas caeni TaxID=3031301 RepID=A0ABT7E282_9NEIS|nr:hypothetical protein [Parachitinimonas caeni]MDK2126422.1 hypothetical protein [Parachitinimonas caeni]